MKVLILKNKKYIGNPVRSAIIEVLKRGIFDLEDVGKDLYRRRRALNAEEILDVLEKQGVEVSRTSLYFHINKMLDLGNIKVIATIREGRHDVKYYGKSAKIVLMRKVALKDEYEDLFSTLGELIKATDNTKPEKDFNNFAASFAGLMRKREESIALWLTQRYDVIEQQALDINKLFKLISDMAFTGSPYVDFWDQFKHHLSLDIPMDE